MTVRERLPSDNETRSGDWNDDTQWHERAAFRIAVESREVSEGRLVWRTRAYHEERDQRRVWTGAPDEALIEWIHDQLRQSIGGAVPSPPRRFPASTASVAPSSDAPADDLQQIPGIGPAIARRLRTAGITTFAALAACSPSDLAAWTGRSAEQIVRMGWIERARDLTHPTPPLEATATEPSPVETAAAAPSTSGVQTRPPPATEPSSVETAATLPEAPPAAGDATDVQPVAETPITELAETTTGTSGGKAAPSAAEEIREVQNMIEEAPIIFAAVLLDEEGEVQDARLTTTGDQPPEWNDQQVARFFIETATPIPHAAVPVTLWLDHVQIDTVFAQPGKGASSRLHATAMLHLEWTGSEEIPRAFCHIFLLAYDLSAGETHILGTTRVEATVGAADVPLTLDTDLPEVGRYQLLLAALMPEASALSVISGPRLRVTP
ncbi:helix-hairpin-helix domain-containing protein [Roseiflexus sp.]|uniref:helix-hairpin-helix domain-containing protein n=1 Tax=Roseiflexus sp. TaxID=2562120 RepID=UPI0021DED1DF|nr:helix-hairpin-helix domain-containing protein [Roseiflexus sp.]GIW01699.1 MAG: hypothetical protein KatS3mg058_3102 [Roseiflexus sp.]